MRLRENGKINIRFIAAILIVMAIAGTLFFIWSNSAASVEVSSEQSEEVLEIVEPIIEPIVGEDNVTDYLIRKMAHFTEYFLLGLEMTLALVIFKAIGVKWVVNISFLALLTAVIDETIQIFSGRGSLVQDVWLDLSGAVCAILLTWGVYSLARTILNKNDR